MSNPKLSIITINKNNSEGLQKTIKSVVSQTSTDFEFIVIDGSSTDNSVDIIKQFENKITYWISETDTGIYNAMNKGIKLAKGEYCQFLNSGDYLVSENVVEGMLSECKGLGIFYANTLTKKQKGIYRDKSLAGKAPTMHDFYFGTLIHPSAFISRELFFKFGFYDEELKIVSDWKWYLKVIILNNVKPIYKNIDICMFDMNGISNHNNKLKKEERKKVLSELIPQPILADYNNFGFNLLQIIRINRYWIAKNLFWLMERCIFKLERWFNVKS